MPVNAPIAFYETKYRQSRSGRSRFYIAAALRSVASDGGRATRLGLQTSISAAAYDLSSGRPINLGRNHWKRPAPFVCGAWLAGRPINLGRNHWKLIKLVRS